MATSSEPASDDATGPAGSGISPAEAATPKGLVVSAEVATAMIRDHQTGVWRYLRALGCESTLADDLVQEAFVAVLQRPFEDNGPVATGAYLRRVAHNLFVTWRRRQGRVVAMEDLEELSGTWDRWTARDDGAEALEALRKCLERLTPRARRALEMRFRERESRAAIAEFLAITEHGAKNLMQRAKHQLRECVEERIAAAEKRPEERDRDEDDRKH